LNSFGELNEERRRERRRTEEEEEQQEGHTFQEVLYRSQGESTGYTIVHRFRGEDCTVFKEREYSSYMYYCAQKSRRG